MNAILFWAGIGGVAASVVGAASLLARRRWRGLLVLSTGVLLAIGLLLVSVLTADRTSADDAKAIRHLIRQACERELSFYQAPEKFSEAHLDQLWVPAAEGGRSAERITNGVHNIASHGWRYAPDARITSLTIRSLQLVGEGREALVETSEEYVLPKLDGDARPVRAGADEHYADEIVYVLVNSGGKWRIISDTTRMRKR